MPVLNAAYNYPGRTQTRCPWDLFFDVSFIYWQPIQENMELAIVDTPDSTTTPTSINGGVVQMDFDYKPGFKIGGGYYFEYDNWDVHGEYTWFHTSNNRSVAVNATAAATQRILPLWGHPAFAGGAVYDTASEKWTMNMDLVDLDLGRWHYVGTKLLFHPYIGMRGAFIRQNAHITYTSDSPFGLSATYRVADIFDKSHSWAVGPRAGLDTTWNVGEGFRIFGCGEADILYTRYTTLTYNEHTIPQSPTVTDFGGVYVTETKVGTLRTHLDMELGIGWGTYWDCNNWYTDVALGYEFQVFFDQNMFRHFNSSSMLGNSTQPYGNLYTQGLTATFSLTF